VQEWTELPLWAAAAGAPGLWAHDSSEAAAAGLACRPVLDTLVDTWNWMQTIPGGWRPSERTPGLSAEQEAALLS
jgi:2'-hydroxyisoflavone reductase